MIVLVGTVPAATGLYIGKAVLEQNSLKVGNGSFSVERGTAAMAASCAQVCNFYNIEMPLCIFGGDVSDGKGTDMMFGEVNSNIDAYNPGVITLHYMFPKVAYGRPFIDKIKSLPKKPQLIADAGGMYLAKTIHQAHYFDVFTPDWGELYFLADEFAPHPLYVRSELLKENISSASLVDTAYKKANTAKTTIVKGAVDYIYTDNSKVKELTHPNIPAMEAIGGTGDTITGMLSALRYMGCADAEYKSLLMNRLIGEEIKCTAATQIIEFITAIPNVLAKYEKSIQ